MLAIKYTPNIFLLSIYVSSLLQQDICFVKVCVCVCVCVLKIWKQLFLSKLIMYLLGQEARAWHLFLICHLYIHEVPTKYPREKSLDLRKYPPEKIWTHNIPTRKN